MSAIENISPSVIKRISRELNVLFVQPPEGIRVIVNELDVCDVQAWIVGPESTPYEGGYFRVKLVLGADFPSAPPKCYFVTKIFHPNVSKSGEVCVNTLKKDWNKDSGIERILLTVKCLLIVPNPESALNEEAGKLLLENYDDYAKHARMMTKIHAVQNKPTEFSSNNSTTTSSSTSTVTSTTTSSTSSPKKFVSSSPMIMMKTTSQQTTTTSTTATTTTINTVNNSSIMNNSTSITPLTVSNSMNESKSSNLINNGGGSNNNHNNHHRKNPTTINSNDNQLTSNNPTVTPKKRAGDKKLDKKPADKKRSLKRL